ncbi:CPBP family intramembrane glutamic endopeptidase [Pseudalkalibacillus sp. A8]|uniref:CPBP family intramembrane glutamic endopeptidase n=1 Tax=Pseudalkalibacillus sp. A8 TaxID=3382641 RepID=UPI0038B6836C
MSKNVFPFMIVLIAWIMLGYAFQSSENFWFLFPLVQGGLLLFALLLGKLMLKLPSKKQIAIGVGSGIVLYGLFAFGKLLVNVFMSGLFEELENLYGLISPKIWWHTLIVFTIIIPAEEFFWRGYVQSRLSGSVRFRLVLSVLLYALAHLASGSILLVLAALFAGIVWAILYEKTKNILVPLLSHLVFDILLFLAFPLL